MNGRLTALIILSTASLSQTAEGTGWISLTVVEHGGDANFRCPLTGSAEKLHWYKQPLGQILQNVVAVINGKENFKEKSDRFISTIEDGQHHLTIRNVSKEDEATYFCHTGSGYIQTFSNGSFLAVKDRKEQKSVYVKQSPETASVQLGKSMTLECSLLNKNKETRVQCPGEHSVHWFKAGSGGFHPGIIYTHSNKSDKQEEGSCVYSLSKTIQNSSDAGTYYCAVVTCGEILIGPGTKVEKNCSDPGSALYPVVIVLGGLLACCVVCFGILIFYINQRNVCEHCKGAMSSSHRRGDDVSNVDQPNNLDDVANAENYAALNFSTRRVKREKKKQRESPQECVYSDVRVYNHS